MKKLLVWTLVIIAIIMSACEEEYETSVSRTQMKLTFYRRTDTSTVNMGVSDTLNIYALKTDSVLGSAGDSTTSAYSLPLSYTADSTVFILRKGAKNFVSDTLVVKYNAWAHFLSMDQGSVMYYNISNATITHHFISYMNIISKNVREVETENLRLYYVAK
jgi:hypothetical protein